MTSSTSQVSSARGARPRLSLTRRFALTSMVGMALVGVALVAAASQALRAQAVHEGVATAETMTGWVRAALPVDVLTDGPVPPAGAAVLTDLVADLDDRLVGFRLWTPQGALAFDSSGPGGSAGTAAPSGEAAPVADPGRMDTAVLRGRSAAAVVSLDGTAGTELWPGPAPTRATQVLDVYVPVRDDGRVVAVAEVLLDQGPLASHRAAALGLLALVAAVGLVILWLVLFRSVHSASERLERSAMENARLALLDALTGLPNRRMLLDRLDRAVDSAAREHLGVGILLLDVDRFKDVNDSLGHDRGDELLVQVAARLMEAFRGRDLVARLGGDEFAVLLPGVASVADAEALAHRARQVFADPFVLGGMSVHVATSIGVATLPEHAADARGLMRKADVAMYTAKHHRLGVAVYDAADDDSSPARLVLQAELHRALTRTDELSMHYQPKVDLLTGRTIGLEALMRWRHPTRGDVEPSVFIPLAEQSGLIDNLTTFALRTVISQLARWSPSHRLPVAVNLSAHTVASGDVVDTIDALLCLHGVAPEWLEIEITETAVVSDPARVVPVLRRLSAAGVRVAIDDFGIGSTSFAQLRDLPVDVLKIDRLFVEDLSREADRPRALTVVKAMVDLAHSFGMEVVAEGVEDGRTAALLLALEVDHAQGYWFSRAISAAEITRTGGQAVSLP